MNLPNQSSLKLTLIFSRSIFLFDNQLKFVVKGADIFSFSVIKKKMFYQCFALDHQNADNNYVLIAN